MMPGALHTAQRYEKNFGRKLFFGQIQYLMLYILYIYDWLTLSGTVRGTARREKTAP